MSPIPSLVDQVDTAFGPEDAHTSSVLAGGFGSNARGSYSEPCRVPGSDCHIVAHLPYDPWRVLELPKLMDLL